MSYSEQLNQLSYTGNIQDSTGQQITNRNNNNNNTPKQQPRHQHSHKQQQHTTKHSTHTHTHHSHHHEPTSDAADETVNTYTDVAGSNVNINEAKHANMTPQQLQQGYAPESDSTEIDSDA